jgi:rare lipoprotein A
LSGRHSVERRRHLVPLFAGIGAAIVLVGGAAATLNLGSDAKPTAATVDVARSAQERADRGARPSPSVDAVEQLGAAPTSASPTPAKTTKTAPAGVASSGTCSVSFYADGQKTANGENFNPDGLTAAHKTLKFGTIVRVTNLANGKSVDVRINDRGPFVAGRCLDLSRGAFVKIASVSAGVINAKYEVLK